MERRSFIGVREVAPLLLGVLRGEPASMRRVLGARRGGRIGIGMALACGALAAGSVAAFTLAASAQVLAGLALSALHVGPLGVREWQRLSLWTAAPALLAAAPLRLVWADSALPALIGVCAGQLLVWHALRQGLD